MTETELQEVVQIQRAMLHLLTGMRERIDSLDRVVGFQQRCLLALAGMDPDEKTSERMARAREEFEKDIAELNRMMGLEPPPPEV